ncbi:hypothetical protein MHUMG1_03591 [Metarhizium humberi]|uniref:Uncharacterized protein n=1 Tax=Metarhizium humberi TaxID=2596975 RepID=A0A9P8S9F9_9HYPO|nr:hypothetical protein MHUMG1_03591 [Metarhizium humberi]
MSYTLYDGSIATAQDNLTSLKAILKKAEAAPNAASLPDARIYEDMLPLSFQKLENDLKTSKGVEEAYWVISSDMRQWFQPFMSESGQRSCERMDEIIKNLDRTIPSWVTDFAKRLQLFNGSEVTRFEGHTRLSLESLYISGELGTQPWRSPTGHGGKNLSATDFSGINLSKAPVSSTGKRTGRLVLQGIRIDMLLEPSHLFLEKHETILAGKTW